MAPDQSFANAETVDRITQQLVWLLKTFHEERQKNGSCRDAEFWRGNFVGMKRAMFAIYGEAVKNDVLDQVRRTTNPSIPHRGPWSPTVFQRASTATRIDKLPLWEVILCSIHVTTRIALEQLFSMAQPLFVNLRREVDALSNSRFMLLRNNLP